MMMATKGKRPLRHLTATDKIDAIQRIHDGESKASVARDIGVPESTLRGWCKNEEKLRYMSRQSAENADKLTSEATAAALTAAAAAELFNGPPEKRMKLEQGLFGNGKLKYDDSFYKSPRGPMNGLDLSGGDKGLGVSGGDIIMNGLHGADFSAFAKTAAEISALSKSKEMNLKGYGADLSKHGDPTKADLSMAAISPLTSLSHLSGMSSLAQSPLALSFNEIANNLNLIAQLHNNHNLTTMSNLGGLSAAQSLRNARPKANTSQSPRTSSLSESNGDKTPSLTVRNLAKLQQKSELTNGRDPNAPVDEALWYWLKSQQLNSLYSTMPRPSSPQQSSSPPQQHQQLQHHPSTQTPTPPIVSTPQPTPPSSAPSLTPEDTKNSSWFWQWYKTFGASLMPGDKSNNNTINTNANSKQSSYENILYSQLTKGQNPDSLNNNAQPMNLNINGSSGQDNLKTEPEDLSNHNNNSSGHLAAPDDHQRFNPSPSTSIKSEPKPEDDEEPQPTTHGEEELPAEPKTNGKVKEVLDNLLFQQTDEDRDSPAPGSMRRSVSPAISNHNGNNSTHDPSELITSNGLPSDEVKSEISEDSNQFAVEIKSSADAVELGEKFLKWLESCSDPNVTAMQVVQFKFLLNSIKLSAERQQQQTVASSGGEERTRVRRRK
ncbi:protein distal antenna-like isoform X2 [Toxorhynchites rutilus septentrionalis]|uniref:protein distal antenna-like isoform X2 n=1 Tax=Toxorhynchites rutilus septentrionalis TaxID=329112 RepID=UPI002478C98F|nr:protein distal antenna-like isoform X2 [Toxorhynchites rutilus septentrionalis]